MSAVEWGHTGSSEGCTVDTCDETWRYIVTCTAHRDIMIECPLPIYETLNKEQVGIYWPEISALRSYN